MKAKAGIQGSRKQMKKTEMPSWTGKRKILECTIDKVWPALSPTGWCSQESQLFGGDSIASRLLGLWYWFTGWRIRYIGLLEKTKSMPRDFFTQGLRNYDFWSSIPKLGEFAYLYCIFFLKVSRNLSDFFFKVSSLNRLPFASGMDVTLGYDPYIKICWAFACFKGQRLWGL